MRCRASVAHNGEEDIMTQFLEGGEVERTFFDLD
jgi:hypothetical protein